MVSTHSSTDASNALANLPQAGELVRLEWGDVGINARAMTRETAIVTLGLLPGEDDLPAPPREQLRVIVERADALYRFEASLRAVNAEDLWTVTLRPESQERVQRREFFRMRIGLPLLVASRPSEASRSVRLGASYLPPAVSGADYRMFRSLDLSGGGCLVDGCEEWLEPGSVHPGFLYLDDGGGPLPLSLLVIRSDGDEDEDQAETVFRFVELKERRRERILRALYREYRRLRASRPETT